MTPIDPFGKTDKLDEPTLAALAGRFEARGRNPRFSKMLREYLDAMSFAPTGRVLDVGCGTGLAARAIARRKGFAGYVTGIDLSPYLVGEAARLAEGEGLAGRLAFRIGDVRKLDFEDATFDALVAHTLLSHVDDPAAVLVEAARVVKPGGTIGIFDGDYASLTFDHPDPAKGKASDEALIGALVTNPRVMRGLPRLLRAAGLELVMSFSYVLSEVGKADFWASAIDAYRMLLVKAAAMSADEANEWAAGLRRDADAGVFFASCNYYSYVAVRP